MIASMGARFTPGFRINRERAALPFGRQKTASPGGFAPVRPCPENTLTVFMNHNNKIGLISVFLLTPDS
jgi:hypothetical protein